jgi:hypothetical protein
MIKTGGLNFAELPYIWWRIELIIWWNLKVINVFRGIMERLKYLTSCLSPISYHVDDLS